MAAGWWHSLCSGTADRVCWRVSLAARPCCRWLPLCPPAHWPAAPPCCSPCRLQRPELQARYSSLQQTDRCIAFVSRCRVLRRVCGAIYGLSTVLLGRGVCIFLGLSVMTDWSHGPAYNNVSTAVSLQPKYSSAAAALPPQRCVGVPCGGHGAGFVPTTCTPAWCAYALAVHLMGRPCSVFLHSRVSARASAASGIPALPAGGRVSKSRRHT